MFKFFQKKSIHSEINRCLNEGVKEVFLKKIKFEAARSYAVDHGTKDVDHFTREPNKYILEIQAVLNCVKYRIIFKRLDNDGTHITILSPGEKTEGEKELGEKIEAKVKEWREKDKARGKRSFMHPTDTKSND